MQNHTIDYFIAIYDGEKDTTCFEIHFKGLVEVSKVGGTFIMMTKDDEMIGW